jgi:hypothetical protein
MTAPSKHRRGLTAALASAFLLLVAIVFMAQSGGGTASAATAEANPCAAPVTNPIACENSKPGDPPGNWQIEGAGDKSIQGFATSISVNVGGTESFKIKTPSSKYHINILRLGYYKGDGARIIEPNIQPSAKLPQEQPPCEEREATGLIDCGNWGVSASWQVPTTAVSGLYVAQLVRDDTGGESQIFFVVKNEESTAPIVFKTSDATWEAYNNYGGNSLYSCGAPACPEGHPYAYKAAYAVSYNRPFDGSIERDGGMSAPFYAEYQMMRWLEKEGYNMTYVAQPDIQANPGLLKKHEIFIASGHDEYWSAGERLAAEEAREAGVNEAFFTGNEIFWKTRWGPSLSGQANRTLITYKETHFNEPQDPEEPNVATSSWRDPRYASGGAGKPENSLTGQLFLVNSGTSDIKVPGTFAKDRFWKNTQVEKLTPTQTLTLAPGAGTLGYEWDVDVDNGFRPAGRIPLSSTTVNGLQTFTDYGTFTEEPTLATHSLSLYRAPSGALVFGAGTVQWAWGLEYVNAWNMGTTEPAKTQPDPNMEQATVNLLAEMGSQPSTLTEGLVRGVQSTDKTPPTATVTSPNPGTPVKNGEMVTVSGTAADTGGGVVAAVEVSTDGGKTWHPATGSNNWTYAWNVDGSSTAEIEVRATDDSANMGKPSTPVTVPVSCPCSLLGAMTPEKSDAGDSGSVTVGAKFQSEIAGTINGIRFFKSAANTGTHIGDLWNSAGELLAEATFTKETETGWQQVEFSKPVAIKANATYVAGYFAPKGHYADTAWQLNNPPALGPNILKHRPLSFVPGTEGGNGLFIYGAEPHFPTKTYHADNYWVDVMFAPAIAPSAATNVQATSGVGQATVSWTAPVGGAPATSYRVTPYVGTTAQTPVTVPASQTSTAVTGLTGGTAYTFIVTALNEAGAAPDSAPSNSVTPTAATVPAAPTGVTATAAPESATVSWTAPASNGGRELTAYKVTPFKAGVAQTAVEVAAGATTKTFTGLTIGASYTFTVAAINSVGQGPQSAASAAVTPTAPSAPGAPTAVAGAGKSSGAVVTWTAPTSNGGSPITGYSVTPYQGSEALAPVSVGGSVTSATIASLTNGTSYTFKVAAVNALGASPQSAASAAVTPYDSIFDLATPGTIDGGDKGSANLGVKFRSDVAGQINGIRFYKAAANTGTHVGSLWSATGGLLAQATFTNESATGWQQVTFSSPVQVQANTTYVASYLAPSGHYSANGPNLAAGVNNQPLHAESGAGNGVYIYSSEVKFPTGSFQSSNYWVDVMFTPEAASSAPSAPTGVTATAAGPESATVTWTAPANNGGREITAYKVTPYKAGVAQTAVEVAAGTTSKTISGLAAGSSYTFTVIAINFVGQSPESAPSPAITPSAPTAPAAPTEVSAAGKSSGAVVTWTAAGNGGSAITGYTVTPYLGAEALAATTAPAGATSATIGSLANGSVYTFKVTATNAIGNSPQSSASSAVTPYDSIFDLATPGTVDAGQGNPVNLGVKFRSDVAGLVNGIRFYKAAANTGTHIGSLWSATGNLLAQATFTNETASGWQQVTFSPPVQIQPNTTYVASYLAPAGHYSANGPNLAAGVDNPPLHAESGTTNGVYTFSSELKFPTSSYQSSNYWVDLLFTPEAAPTVPSVPTAVTASAGPGSTITVTWSAPTSGSAPTSYVITPYIGSTAQAPKTITGTAPATSTSVGSLTPGTNYTFTVKAVNAAGSSAESSPSGSVTAPVETAPPGVPTNVSASARNAGALVSWSEPASNGGAAITGYKVTPYLGSEALTPTNVGGGATSVTIGSLANGSAYTFKVTASNSVGSGAESAATSSVMPRVTLFESMTPATPEVAESASVTLGVKFSSAVAGQIRGVRFFKSAANTGTHVVGLWTSSGTLLAQAVVSNETPSGWQEANFATPVAIAANTTYVAGYLAPKGRYSATSHGFATAITSSPLTSPASTTSPNGLFSYGPSLVFPVSSYSATNYFVDVLFTP